MACVVYAGFALGSYEGHGRSFWRMGLAGGSEVIEWASAVAQRLAFQVRAAFWPALLLVLVNLREPPGADAGGI